MARAVADDARGAGPAGLRRNIGRLDATKADVGILQAMRGMLSLIPSKSRARYFVLLACTVFVSFLETGVLGVVAFFATSILNPESVMQSSYVVRIGAFWPGLAAMPVERFLLYLGSAMVVLVVLKNCLRALVQYAYMRHMALLSGYLGESMLKGLMRMPYSWLMNENSADLMSTIQFSLNSGTFFNSVFTAVSESVLVLTMFFLLVAANPSVLLMAVAVLGIPAYLLIRWTRKTIDDLATRGREHFRGTIRTAMVALQGLMDVKIYGKEQSFCDKFSRHVYQRPLLQAKQEIVAGLPAWILECLGFGLLFLTMVLIYFVLDDNTAKLTGTLALLAVFAWRGLPAIVRTVNSVNMLRTTLPYVRDTLANMEIIKNWADADPELAEKEAIPGLRKKLALQDVEFHYGRTGQPVLRNISFAVGKGQSVGIVGTSGAGKSTIMNLMIGLLEPTGGNILLDDAALTRDTVRSWTLRTGYIPQSPYIFDATLAENVAFGEDLDEIDRDRMAEACAKAAVNEFLDDLPDGYETYIGERGIRLSGGQQQRICIARALYNRPDVLLFDEATSSLDTRSERQIQQTIDSLKGTVTMVIVAHRLSTVENCDAIVWLHEGRVRMQGAPEEVLPLYNAHLKQSGREADALSD